MRRLRLAADDYDSEFRDHRRDRADGSEERGEYRAYRSDGDGNLDERVPVYVFHYDALDVAFVNQLTHLIDQVVAQDLNLFNELIESHT